MSSLFIANRWSAARAHSTFASINPATEKVIGTLAAADKADVHRAVCAAHNALHGTWKNCSSQERGALLERIANRVAAQKESLARLESEDCGKPIAEARMDVDDCITCLRYYAKLADGLDASREETIDLPDDAFRSVARQEPIGVVAAVIPWNFPLLMLMWKFAPAIAAGCTLVLKPSEFTSLTAIEFAKIVRECDLPEGVFNVVTGFGASAGAPLVCHPLVRKVAFTGSVATGSAIMKSAASDVKVVTLELGGKSPIIVFDDCDVEQVVDWVMIGIFFNQGEVCSATSRLLLQKGIAKKVLDRLVEETKKLTVGDPLNEETKMGPLVSKDQLEKVMELIESGKESGAQLLTGGSRLSQFDSGYYVAPTIFADVPTDARIWKEEIFGPVLCVRTFTTEDEALQEANDTDFGLAAAVMSKDIERANRVARNLRAGIVWVNCSQPTFVEAPWGGFKRSGIGRELGRWGLQNYLQTKQITSFCGPPDPYYLTPKL